MLKHNIIYKLTNSVNNMIYIGAHCTDNLNDKYFGSGTRIKRAIRYYGKSKFIKEILFDFDNPIEMYKKELEIVNEEFINRKNTYNCVIGGSGWASGLISVKDKDNNYMFVDKDDPRYLSRELVGCSTGYVMVKDKTNKVYRVKKDDPRYLSGELKHIRTGYVTVKDNDGNTIGVKKDDPRYLSGELKHMMKNCVIVKDKNGNNLQVKKDDPRYLSGELNGCTKNTITVRDKDNNYFRVKKDDPRYLSGELIFNRKGITLSKEHIQKMKDRPKLTGTAHAQYGKVWIYNDSLKKNKRIGKDEELPINWNYGKRIYK